MKVHVTACTSPACLTHTWSMVDRKKLTEAPPTSIIYESEDIYTAFNKCLLLLLWVEF